MLRKGFLIFQCFSRTDPSLSNPGSFVPELYATEDGACAAARATLQRPRIDDCYFLGFEIRPGIYDEEEDRFYGDCDSSHCCTYVEWKTCIAYKEEQRVAGLIRRE